VVVLSPSSFIIRRRNVSCAGGRVEQHLVALRVIGDEPERAASVEFNVRDVQASPQAANKCVVATPVELERFTGFESQARRPFCAELLPAPRAGVSRTR
jgi:hypothetical protein